MRYEKFLWTWQGFNKAKQWRGLADGSVWLDGVNGQLLRVGLLPSSYQFNEYHTWNNISGIFDQKFAYHWGVKSGNVLTLHNEHHIWKGSLQYDKYVALVYYDGSTNYFLGVIPFYPPVTCFGLWSQNGLFVCDANATPEIRLYTPADNCQVEYIIGRTGSTPYSWGQSEAVLRTWTGGNGSFGSTGLTISNGYSSVIDNNTNSYIKFYGNNYNSGLSAAVAEISLNTTVLPSYKNRPNFVISYSKTLNVSFPTTENQFYYRVALEHDLNPYIGSGGRIQVSKTDGSTYTYYISDLNGISPETYSGIFYMNFGVFGKNLYVYMKFTQHISSTVNHLGIIHYEGHNIVKFNTQDTGHYYYIFKPIPIKPPAYIKNETVNLGKIIIPHRDRRQRINTILRINELISEGIKPRYDSNVSLQEDVLIMFVSTLNMKIKLKSPKIKIKLEG